MTRRYEAVQGSEARTSCGATVTITGSLKMVPVPLWRRLWRTLRGKP